MVAQAVGRCFSLKEHSTIFDIACGRHAGSHFYNTPPDWSQGMKLTKTKDETVMTTPPFLRIASVISLIFAAVSAPTIRTTADGPFFEAAKRDVIQKRTGGVSCREYGW
jgi:hypothetical protein